MPPAARRLYTAALALATLLAAPAAALDPAARAAVEAAATGEMEKLVLAEDGKGPYETPYARPDGSEGALDEFAGKVVVANFWATWCPPCLKEMPSLDRLAAAMAGEDVVVVAVSADRGSIEKPQRWLAENGVEVLTLRHDPRGKLAREVGVLGMPSTLILDREGREVARYLGEAEWDAPEAQAVVRALVEATR